MLLPLLTLYPPHAALCLGGVRSQHWLDWGYRGDQDGSDFGPKEAFDKHSGLGALFWDLHVSGKSAQVPCIILEGIRP